MKDDGLMTAKQLNLMLASFGSCNCDLSALVKMWRN